jgi:DNA-binding NarL/FixJ family response regulator
MATKKKKLAPPDTGLFGPILKEPPTQEIVPALNAGTAMAQQQEELIDNLLRGRLAGEIKVSIDGTLKIRAQDTQGATVTFTGYVNERTGYREEGLSILPQRLSPTDRREEVRRLAAAGLTQQAIAERLGVSQKTVSNDIKKN